MNQRTIEKETFLEGIGLHTGEKVRLNFKPSEPGKGIKFSRIDLNPNYVIDVSDFDASTSLSINPEQSRILRQAQDSIPSLSKGRRVGFGSLKRRTTISKGNIEIQTVEHLMATLWALSINNIFIEIDSEELPGLDGSAKDFFICLKNAGIKEQNIPQKVIKIKEPIWCEKGDSFVGVFPSPNFKISYILESPSPSIGRQCLSIELNQETFYKEIAGARTFCLKEEAESLLKQGFGKGANLKNTLVMDENGPIDNVLRFPDEPVRHKILDLIGDLYLIGRPIEGRVIGIRSGHDLNMELVKKLMTNNKIQSTKS